MPGVAALPAGLQGGGQGTLADGCRSSVSEPPAIVSAAVHRQNISSWCSGPKNNMQSTLE